MFSFFVWISVQVLRTWHTRTVVCGF